MKLLVLRSAILAALPLLSAWSVQVDAKQAFPALTSLPKLTPTEVQIAAILDAACPESLGNLHEVCEEMIGLSESMEEAALGEIAPDEVAEQSTVPLRIGTQGPGALLGRLQHLRLAERVVAFAPGSVRLAGGYGGGGNAGDSPTFSFEPFRDGALGLFLQGRFQAGNGGRFGNPAAVPFDFENRGVTLGTDYRFNDRLTMGLSLAYQNLDTKYRADQAHMRYDSLMGAFYGSYFLPRDFYLAWVLDYTAYDYSVIREIHLPDFSNHIRGNPSGGQYGFSFNLGKDWQFGAWGLHPYFRLEYANLRIDPYRERDSHNLALAFSAQSDKSLLTSMGTQITHAFSTPFGVLVPGLRFEWSHQDMNDERAIHARFLALPAGQGGFTVQTGRPDRDYFNLGGSLSLALPGGSAAFLQYETRLGQNGVSAHGIEAGFRVAF